jgi:ankyrin repeat protein
VFCQLDTLRRCLPARIRTTLDELPRTLDATYERTLQDIVEENWEYAHRLFQCIAVSSRPLRVEELAEFLAIDFDAGGIPPLVTGWRPPNPRNAVLSVCSSLITVVIVDGSLVVQFSHFSVKEFLTSSRLASERISRYRISLEPAHTIVVQACLSVLLQLDNHIDKQSIEKHPLAPYAAQHWVDHAKFQNVSSHVELEDMKHLFDRDRQHFAAWVWIYDMDRESQRSMDSETPLQPSGPPIYYATLWDFPGMTEWLVTAHSQDVNEQGGFYGTPLCAAAARGCLSAARALVKCGAHVDAAGGAGWSPLLWASDSGHLETSQLMLDLGADINFRDSLNRTPLSLASGKGHMEIAKLLLQHGADVNVWQRGEGTVLIKALQREDFAFAELLLKYRADVNSQDDNGLSLLHQASGHRGLASVQWLLDHGAKFASRNDQGSIPFPEGDRRTLGSLLSSIYSLCLSYCCHCIINPKGHIRLPDLEEGELQDTSIGPTVKRHALLVGISYAYSQSDTWWELENHIRTSTCSGISSLVSSPYRRAV